MRRKAVVVWSGSATAWHALDWAVTWWGADEVTLLHVADWEEPDTDFFTADSPAEGTRTRLDEEVERARGAFPDVVFSTEIEHSVLLSAVLAHTAAGQLLVFGIAPTKHRKSHLRWSIQTRVAAIAHGPVVLVPPLAAAGEEPRRSAEIVVGIDGSRGEEVLIRTAAEEAQRSGSRLRLVHAWTVPSMWEAEESLDDDVLIRLESSHRALLDETVRTVGIRYPAIDVAGTLTQGEASEAIISASLGAALVVVGRHRLERYERMFLGSVSHSVLLGISAPTLVLPLTDSA